MIERMKDITPPRFQTASAQPLVSSRAKTISETLRKMAVRARGKRRIWTAVNVPTRRWEGSFGAYIFWAFVAIVAIPALVAGIYLAVFISDQYASETRFAVRSAERASFDPLSSLIGVPSASRVQEAQIISEYIRGRGIVEELEKTMNLRQKFTGPHVDLLSAFHQKDSIEDLVKYWWWHVDVEISAISGIVKVVVRAFTPQDALELANAILASSERLVNEMSERSRNDALRISRNELQMAESDLQSKIRALQDLRNAEGLLDVDKTSDALTQILAEMRLELIRMDREYNAQRQTVAADSPQLRVLESRMKASREQIRRLESQMTGPSQKAAPVLAESMSRFERMKLDHDIAQKRYVSASAAYEKARVDSTTQQVYLTTFVPPTLAEEALYPRRFWIFTIILAACLAVWGLGTGAAVLIRNNMA